MTPDHSPFPGPSTRAWGLPLLRAMRRDYLGWCAQLQRTWGDRVASRIGRERMVDIFDPEDLRAVLVDDADALIRWERGPEVFSELVGQSVLVTEGEAWRRQRRMLQPGFAPRRMERYGHLMADAITDHLDRVLPEGRDVAVIEAGAWFSTVTMDIILRALFSARTGQPAETEQLCADVQHLSEVALREMFWPMTLPDAWPLPGKAAKRAARRRLQEVVRGHIAARATATAEGSTPPDDLLSMLTGLRDDDTGATLAATEVFDQCMLTFQAGHETSASALVWWSWLMARHPQAQALASAEVDAVLQGRSPTASDPSRLPMLTATLKEAMRLYPPIAALMTRRTTRPITLAGRTLPTGTLLRLTPWVLHRDARWFPDPSAFRPERFLPDAPPPPRGAYLPFGVGPRVCLGQHFAMLELTQVAALLLQRAHLACPDGQSDPALRLGVTLRPAGPLQLRLERRPPGDQGPVVTGPGTAA